MSATRDRAREALRLWAAPSLPGGEDNPRWREEGPLREALDGIHESDALALLDDARALGAPDDHLVADEIVVALLPEAVRDRHRAMSDRTGSWWFS